MTDNNINRLAELLEKKDQMPFCTYKEEARWLIENGVIVLDMKAIAPINRPLITHIAGMPINDVLELIREKEWKL